MHFSIKDNFRASVEAASNGKRTVLYDDYGNPSIMYRLQKFDKSEIKTLGQTGTHEAFIYHGKEIDELFISVTHNVLGDGGCAVSMPGVDPKVYITYDQAVAACKKKGKGWHVMSNAEWSALALQSYNNGTMPHGNNNFGSDIDNPKEKGRVTYTYTDNGTVRNGRTATCSGPDTWFHDHTRDGVDGMNGNVWEWIGGLKSQVAQIMVPGEGGVAMNNFDVDDSHYATTGWLQSGLYFDQTNTPQITNSVTTWNNTDHNSEDYNGGKACTFGTLATKSGVTLPAYFKSLLIAPFDTAENLGNDYFYIRNTGERQALRGGAWASGRDAGLFSLHLGHPRSHSNHNIGFRCVFAPVGL